MTTISAMTILSSQLAQMPSKRLSCLYLCYPRWIHAEGRTHRIISLGEGIEISIPTPGFMNSPELSKNAASSRAIPVLKMIADIEADPAVPIFWGKNVAGMQAKEELPPHLIAIAEEIWLETMHMTLAQAKRMMQLAGDEDGNVIGAHKQIINRMLEPYSHIRVLASGTEWENFLELRDHGDAEPHIAMLARLIRAELEKPAMQILRPGEWHTPFVDRKSVTEELLRPYLTDGDTSGAAMPDEEITLAMVSKSTACCASTSYKTVDGFDMTLQRADALYGKLVTSKPIHASPCEHVAMADKYNDQQYRNGEPKGWTHRSEHRNFVGFRQHRAMIGA